VSGIHKFVPCGSITLAGDKSIAHRALLLGAISCGKTILNNFPLHDDSLSTLNALIALGVKIKRRGDSVIISGTGLRGLKASGKPVFVNNSGTTLRLLAGLLSGMDFTTRLTAADSLLRRPMSRINNPLRLMGARIRSRKRSGEEYAPLIIKGGRLKGIIYRPAVASAQVKSAILLAGLFAQGKTKVIERVKTRDHTERMLKIFGADLAVNNRSVILKPGKTLASPGRIYIPGDISSAAFFMVLAAIVPGSKVAIRHLSLNPTRSGIINVLKRMQAAIKIVAVSHDKAADFEPIGDIVVRSSRLKGTVIGEREIPSLVDELPILMVAACFAEGRTLIKGAGELRVKETDRINSMTMNLKNMGADIRILRRGRAEDIVIRGQGRLCGAKLKSFGDHRTAMSMVVAALAAQGESRLDDIGCVSKSFPDFLKILKNLKADKS
jgi:3-phosphoshikimate 1-carboxyvinyltransferase